LIKLITNQETITTTTPQIVMSYAKELYKISLSYKELSPDIRKDYKDITATNYFITDLNQIMVVIKDNNDDLKYAKELENDSQFEQLKNNSIPVNYAKSSEFFDLMFRYVKVVGFRTFCLIKKQDYITRTGEIMGTGKFNWKKRVEYMEKFKKFMLLK